MKNKNILYIFYLLIILSLFLIIIYLGLNNYKNKEPFISYLNEKKNILSRNIRYRSQYLKKDYLDNFINKIKKLLY